MDIQNLLEIMARLRDPERGCPWDREQTFASIAPYTIEEAYEVADAIEREALDELPDELGDLLLQVVYHARMAEESGAFDFGDVVERICAKMMRRHPHVFGDAAVATAEQQTRDWERLKAAERTAGDGGAGLLDDVPASLPGLTRAAKLGRRAATVGFDWPAVEPVRAKVDEELGEVDSALAAGDGAGIAAEIGDTLFAIAQLCRHLGVDPEACLRGANDRFIRRFRHVESCVGEDGRGWSEFAPAELERFWESAKRVTGSPPGGPRDA